MPRIAMLFGVVLVLLGIVLYAMSEPEHKSLTAFIPSGFGLVLVLLGQIAQGDSEKRRMHTMHAAVLVGLVGMVVPAVMTALDIQKHYADPPAERLPSTLATTGKATMAVICCVFVGLCVKSFIDVRRARKQTASAPPN